MTPGSRRHATGVLILTASTLAYSTAGLFTRLIALDAWTMLFWRGAFAGLFLAGVLLVQRRGRPARLALPRWPDLAIAAASSCGMIFYIHALRQTSVADVAVIYAILPFVAAILAFVLLGERPGRSTLAAGGLALAGMAVMVGDSLGAGSLAGDLLALGMTISVSLVMVLARRHRNGSMIGAACLSSFLTALLAGPMASPLQVGAAELGLLALFGVSQLGLGLLLLLVGSARLPPAEAALIGSLDVPLAPLWIWFAFGTLPSTGALVGGSIVLAAVVGNILAENRASVPAASAASQ